MIRVTTNSTLRTYKSSLLRASGSVESARSKVLTQRNFTSYAEDPAAASQAFRIRRAFARNSDYLTNTNSLISKFEAANSAAGTVKKAVEDAAQEIAKRAANDPTASGRDPLGEVLNGTAQSIVQTLNTKYGDSFLFSGSDGLTVPFSWDKDGGLLFRGVPVDAGSPDGLPAGTPPDPDAGDLSAEWAQYYADNPDFETLSRMSYESAYIDVGAGLSENSDGTLNTASAFNGALSGLNFLGFGVDGDGDPKNAASLIKRLGDIYSRCDPDTGAFDSEQDAADAERLGGKLDKALAEVGNAYVEQDSRCTYLSDNKERLTDAGNSLNEQVLSIEQVNMADAITEFLWAQYCYNSALKVGTNILSQSLIDYMG